MTSQSLTEAHLTHPRSQQALHSAKALVVCYLGISLLTLAAIVLLNAYSKPLGDIAAILPASVWIRSIIVVVHAGVTLGFAVGTARGSRVRYILLRLDSAIMVVAIAVILALPSDFPLWFKIEQGVCGLLLLGVVAIINGKQLRATFASK
jgi:hypothetical protein